jgi:hypothetical protein
MKTQDVITQLIGEPDGWDQWDTFNFVFYNVEHNGIKYKSVDIDFENGIVTYWNDEGDKPLLKFAIRATLEHINQPESPLDECLDDYLEH